MYCHPFYLIKMGPPCLFLIYFGLFKQTLQFLQQIDVKKVHPVYGAGVWTLNPQLLEHESPPITTGPGHLLMRCKLALKCPKNSWWWLKFSGAGRLKIFSKKARLFLQNNIFLNLKMTYHHLSSMKQTFGWMRKLGW